MFDVKTMFEQQTRWQRSRANLSWTEKLRMAETLRKAAIDIGSNHKKTRRENEKNGRER